MLDTKQQEFVGRVATTLQIITAALAIGVGFFAAVVMVVALEPGEEDAQPIITMIGVAAAIASFVAAMVVPKIVAGAMRRAMVAGKLPPGCTSATAAEIGKVGQLAGIYQTKTILGVAILEGAAFLNLIAYLIEGQTIALACAAALLIAIFFNFPTRGGIENWINDERKAIEELRSLEG